MFSLCSRSRRIVGIKGIRSMNCMVAPTLEARQPQPPHDPAAALDAILARPDSELDFAKAAVAIDRIVDPGIEAEPTLADLDRLVQIGGHIAGRGFTGNEALAALRTVLHRPGPWNGERPFHYDRTGAPSLRLKLISDYLR